MIFKCIIDLTYPVQSQHRDVTTAMNKALEKRSALLKQQNVAIRLINVVCVNIIQYFVNGKSLMGITSIFLKLQTPYLRFGESTIDFSLHFEKPPKAKKENIAKNLMCLI